MLIDGLPPGTMIDIHPKYWPFFCDPIPCGQPGGNLGGDVEIFDSTLDLEMSGIGTLAGFRRNLQLPVAVETHTGPRSSPSPQAFDTDIASLQGSLPPGDPDFGVLTITAGTSNALPSPGLWLHRRRAWQPAVLH